MDCRRILFSFFARNAKGGYWILYWPHSGIGHCLALSQKNLLPSLNDLLGTGTLYFGLDLFISLCRVKTGQAFSSRTRKSRDSVRGYIDQLPNGDDQGQRFSLRVISWDEQDLKDLPERIYLSWSNAWQKKKVIPNLVPGQEWQFLVKLKRPHSLMNHVNRSIKRSVSNSACLLTSFF